jgi:hypothetical protein
VQVGQSPSSASTFRSTSDLVESGRSVFLCTISRDRNPEPSVIVGHSASALVAERPLAVTAATWRRDHKADIVLTCCAYGFTLLAASDGQPLVRRETVPKPPVGQATLIGSSAATGKVGPSCHRQDGPDPLRIRTTSFNRSPRRAGKCSASRRDRMAGFSRPTRAAR